MSNIHLKYDNISGLTNNMLIKYTSTNSGVENSIIYDNGVNIGVGTVSPSCTLEINGTAKMTDLVITNSLSATSVSGDTVYGNDFPTLPYVDGQTIEIYEDITGGTYVRVMEIIESPSGGTRTFLGNIIISSGLTVSGDTKVQDLVIKKTQIVPTGSTHNIGEDGSITWDDSNIYWKANGQWLKISGTTF